MGIRNFVLALPAVTALCLAGSQAVDATPPRPEPLSSSAPEGARSARQREIDAWNEEHGNNDRPLSSHTIRSSSIPPRPEPLSSSAPEGARSAREREIAAWDRRHGGQSPKTQNKSGSSAKEKLDPRTERSLSLLEQQLHHEIFTRKFGHKDYFKSVDWSASGTGDTYSPNFIPTQIARAKRQDEEFARTSARTIIAKLREAIASGTQLAAEYRNYSSVRDFAERNGLSFNEARTTGR